MKLPPPPHELFRRAMGRKDGKTPLERRGHSYRNYNPHEFIEYSLDEEGNLDFEKQREARNVLKRMEGGRWHPMLDKASIMFAALDPDEKEMWADRNPGIMVWVGVLGFLEDLNTYEKYSGIKPTFDYVSKEDDRG